MRVVRKSDGSVAFDGKARTPGRGAYVCSMTCLVEAIKTRKLQKSLKTAINKDEADALIGQALEAFGDDAR